MGRDKPIEVGYLHGHDTATTLATYWGHQLARLKQGAEGSVSRTETSSKADGTCELRPDGGKPSRIGSSIRKVLICWCS